MDPKIIEEIKRRNKLKMQQWEDRLKIGKLGKGTTAGDAAASSAAPSTSRNESHFNMLEDDVSTPAVEAQAPVYSKPSAPRPAAASSDESVPDRFDIGPSDPSKMEMPAPAREAAPAPQQAAAAQPLPPNVKQLHIDIIDGKIKLSRRNMSLEQAMSTLAKVYNNYKKKMKK